MRREIAFAVLAAVLDGCSSYERPYETWGPQQTTSQSVSGLLPVYQAQARAWSGPQTVAKSALSPTAGSRAAMDVQAASALGAKGMAGAASAGRTPGDVSAPWPGGPGIDAGGGALVSSVLGVHSSADTPTPAWPPEPSAEDPSASVTPCGGRDQESEVRGQGSEVRGQRSEVRGQRSEVRDPRSGIGNQGAGDAQGPGNGAQGPEPLIVENGSQAQPIKGSLAALPPAEPVAAHIVSVGDRERVPTPAASAMAQADLLNDALGSADRPSPAATPNPPVVTACGADRASGCEAAETAEPHAPHSEPGRLATLEWNDTAANDSEPACPSVMLANPVDEPSGANVPNVTLAAPTASHPRVALASPMELPGTATVTTSKKASPCSSADQRDAATEAGPASVVRVVGSRRIHLQYEVAGVGPSGVDQLELWCTRDGGHWHKHSIEHHTRPPYVLDVDDDDLYGFTLVAHSGVGVGSKPPRDGDQPQVWVEVDTTQPAVRLLNTRVDRDAEGRQLTVLWKATDKNFGPRPITISYAPQADGPWMPVAAHVENSGRCTCPLPAAMPHRFFVRIDAVDLAGNRGAVQTRTALLDDAAQPTASIVTVEPGE
jgi:hypothetical protein